MQQKGHKKYIQKSYNDNQKDTETKEKCEEFDLSLNLDKIKQDEKFDGFYAIHTSSTSLTPIEVIESYHNLYTIEESFRTLKYTFNTRPIFHYTQKRIEGHFIISFIAFFIDRHLEYRLKMNTTKLASLMFDIFNINQPSNFSFSYDTKGLNYA